MEHELGNKTNGGPGGGQQKEDMEITVGGKGREPTIRFRIGAMAIVNGLILLVGFSITFSILRVDVDTLKMESKQNASQIHVVVQKLHSIETALEFTREDIRFLRDELAERKVLQGSKQNGGRTGDGR